MKKEYYAVNEYQKTQIEELKIFEEQVKFIKNLAYSLDRFLQFKRYKANNTKYYIAIIYYKIYKIKFIDFKEFLEKQNWINFLNFPLLLQNKILQTAKNL